MLRKFRKLEFFKAVSIFTGAVGVKGLTILILYWFIRRVDSAIDWINPLPVDKLMLWSNICFHWIRIYLTDSNINGDDATDDDINNDYVDDDDDYNNDYVDDDDDYINNNDDDDDYNDNDDDDDDYNNDDDDDLDILG